MADAEVAVEARDVVKVFGSGAEAFRALDGVSIAIRPNEFFTLLGPSGCGKTTLLRLIAGFEYPSGGTLRLDGENVGGRPPHRRAVNTVFQSYALFPHMTVERNVAFGLEMLGRPRAEIARRVDEVLALVRLDALRRRSTAELSGGQQQRVALARALAPSPSVLLLDEPLSALDYKLRKEMQIELKRMQHETGITFVFVTHDQEEALTMSDRIAVMSAGRVLQIGSPHDVYERPADRFVADFIGETNFLDGEIEDGAGGSLRVRLDAGGTLLAEPGPDAPRTGRCTVAVRPEHARLSPPDGADEATLVGTLRDSIYSGTATHHHVELAGGHRFVALGGRGDGIGSGDGSTAAGPGPDRTTRSGAPVRVHVHPGSARVFGTGA